MSQSSWGVFWSSRMSKVGVALLIVYLFLSIYVLVSYPLDFGTRFWNNPAYWADNPKEAPPEWTAFFATASPPRHMVFRLENPSEYTLTRFSYSYDDFPSFISITVSEITYSSRPPFLLFELIRPDGKVVTFYALSVSRPLPGEQPPYRRHHETPLRVFISGDPDAGSFVSRFLRNEYGLEVGPDEVVRTGVERYLFGEFVNGRLVPLSGEYALAVTVDKADEADTISELRVVFGGKVYGVMGTDRLGRDLATGLLFGFPVSLLIGILTASLTTAIGTILGMLSGYIGGKTDTIIQRTCDILNNIPLLPLLIFFTFILRPSIWIIIVVFVAFGWSGLAVIVRNIVMQARTAQFVESAESIGVPRSRILRRYIFPQIAPFIIAQLIFSTPSAILAEAALSFLGLGDPSLPSWGQILEYAFRSGGVNLGLWWWIFPPGALIALLSFTFVMLSMGLEPVVSPRLRRGV
ncbi:MAG: ABC transporter permease [Candidatus Caldarchaeum sp.]